MRKVRHSLLGAASLLLLGACTKEETIEAHYGADQCRRVTVTDITNGQHIIGAEDFVLDERHGRLFVAAYDRHATERAVRKKAMVIPNGGVYSLSLADVFDTEVLAVKAVPLASPGEFAGGLRPHGMTYDEANQELIFINRTYQRINGAWKMTPRLQRIGANGEVFIGDVSDAPCAANNVLVTDQHVLTSYDHGACGWTAGLEDIFNLKRSGVAIDGKSVFESAAYANGLTRLKDGKIVMAATREKALVFFQERAGGIEEASRKVLPGGPDNLSASYDGDVVAALHPSLWRLALNRKFGFGKAPSRIVKIDPSNGGIETLFNDPKGRLFSAATVAIETEKGLVAGSVTDTGLLVCQGAQ